MDEDQFRTAMLACANAILPMHIGQVMINKVFGRAMQSHAAGLVVIMHCEAELNLGPAATLAALKSEFEQSRTLSAFIGLLKCTGFIRNGEHPNDQRVRTLVPSAMLIGGLKSWLMQHVKCGAMAGIEFPVPDLAGRLDADPYFATHYIAATRNVLYRTRASLEQRHAWAMFDRFDCGDRVCLMLLKAHYECEQTGNAEPWFPLEVSRIASQIGISQSHVRNIVNAAETAGYLKLNKRSGEICLTPHLLEEVREWHLMFWSWLKDAADIAVERSSVTSSLSA
ncbi:hypothetical protein ACFSE1_08455 [Rhizobium helianthi]|uniref:MarR family transcriptional regulator n=1 Tax=Rhizobium helianthi TaxID=1132695 RepID=A0ABW4M3I9_9HYPH